MPTGLKQPVGQKRLTNIAVVRLRKAGVVFEIACYKNKVSNWRAEIETDLDEVLQTTAIFNNVSKGVMAKESQLQNAFGTTEEEKICLEILAKGELQVSDKERKLEYDNFYKDVASIIAEKCIDPKTNRQYTATIIERALKDVHFNPDLKKSAKQQAFTEALPLLQQRFSIQRANMRIRLRIQMQHKVAVQQMIDGLHLTLETTEVDAATGMLQLACLIDPGMYRTLHKQLEETTKGTGGIELMNLVAFGEAQMRAPTMPENEQRDERLHPSTTSSVSVVCSQSPNVKRVKDIDSVVIYSRGSISGLSEDFARKQMFAEIDAFEEGWEVELTKHQGSDVVQAFFYSPSGEAIGPFAKARRQALSVSKNRKESNQSQT